MQPRRTFLALLGLFGLSALAIPAEEKPGNTPPPGFTALFNGKDLTGWQSVIELPQRKKLTEEALAKKIREDNEKFLPHWKVQDGILTYDGKGRSLQTTKDY